MQFRVTLKKFPFFVFFFIFQQNLIGQKVKLFNGKNLQGWDLVIDGQAINKDPERYVQVHDETVHMYKDTGEDRKVPFGYIATQDSTFHNFYFQVEYRWGEKKFKPRKSELRDAGILFHINNERVVWPSSVEYQIQEGDTGDLIFLKSGGLSYKAPHGYISPAGKGIPYALPESGGIPENILSPNYGYFGRMPVQDSLSGWNKCEIVVHGGNYAEYLVNGSVIARTGNFTNLNGSPLCSGSIALQLEAAEIQYRNIFVEKLDLPLKVNKRWLSFSKVSGASIRTQTVTLTNPSKQNIALDIRFVGKNKEAFRLVNPLPDSISAGAAQNVEIGFSPVSLDARQSAGLKIGGLKYGAFVSLQGLVLKKFEGKNEVSLNAIVETLGIPVNVGGAELHLNTSDNIIGESIDVKYFNPIDGMPVKVTPLARFSPVGSPPFGIIVNGKMRKLGTLQDVSESVPDAHQRLFPHISGFISSIEFHVEKPFSFYFQGPKYISSTSKLFPSKASIKYTARVFPVHTFMGKEMKNAHLIGFEEASNGDYQDAVFLIENVTIDRQQ